MGSPLLHVALSTIPSCVSKSMAAFEGANQRLKEMERLRKEQDLVIRKINKIHSKLSQTPPEKAEKYGEKLWFQLRGFYVQAKNLADEEESLIGNSITEIEALIAPGQAPPHRKKSEASNEQKRKRIKTETDLPRLSSPALPRTPAAHLSVSVGDQVAARVTADEAENHEWIVVKVTGIDRVTNEFEVIDEEPDDDGESGQRAYKLSHTCIIPFPKRSDASNVTDFPPGSNVLALYPGTTALYKASVVGPNRKRRNEDYLLEFDGDEEEGMDGLPKRQVPFYHVVTLPEGHRQ
ncbi:SAGA-associated factor 29 [Marchantia polymorpha subsp. ruderalis]